MPTDTKIVNFVPVYSIHSIEKYSCSYSVGPVAIVTQGKILPSFYPNLGTTASLLF